MAAGMNPTLATATAALSATVLAAAVAGGVLVAAAVLAVAGLALHRRRLDRRFARKLSPYARRRLPGGQVLDPEEWTRR
ncbi:MAG: hypothetical protein ACYCUG_16215 [Acidimicrobiales bacterium]